LELEPDFVNMTNIEQLGVIATAPGDNVDFVSRFFAPKAGINEDPVTGSAHCMLIPYWADRLGKSKLDALQLSKREGKLSCKFKGERVEIAGKAVTYLVGKINI
ncbi:MAG: PhzF family phenazine biosynthesis protein, partial [Cyclobacteriaceae bacterium]|nr:PhzF family phenazine biosynthesis protein [Cyclobacteriaceae bacterium]MCK5469541.1 PhzF family phenazine biosynthesis protein [Cyclobacteriaceae bacterium]